MANRELADIFSEIADLLEITGQDPFRVNSYRRAARSIDDLSDDVADLVAADRLKGIPGVGKGTAEKITQYVTSGQVDLHQELLGSVPEGLPALLAIPGMGPKKVQAVWKQLGVENVGDLKAAIESGRLAELSGFGAKTAEKLLAGIEFLGRSAGRTPLGVAWSVAEALAEALRAAAKVDRVEIAGSVRRGRETVGDVDLLCESTRGAEVVEAFTQLPLVKAVQAAGKTKGSVRVATPEGGELQVDLRVVSTESFGAAWQYFTGSKEHNVRLRELAVKKKWKLNEYGLFDGDTMLAGAKEVDIYRKLGLPFIEPELREDRGEFERAGELPKLLCLDDMRGDLHMHTTASDGRNTLEAMAAAAKGRGYAYIAICDHSHSSAIANGLSAERLEAQIEAIRAFNAKKRGIIVLAGTECDVLSDGRLDWPDELLVACDYVVASLHSAMGQDRKSVTRRTIQAMENPYVTVIGHPTGRLLGKREAMDLDIDAVIQAAVQTHTALEINASWQRLDLKDTHVRQAVEAGAMLAINTDAHSTEQLGMMQYGVQTARRGWATKASVLNAQTLAGLKKCIARKREG
ncbi:MAG: DNA polymerase/3'-5' exonuclease PolX [Phycisphaerae bacterium]|nr:DNA polymerase/3'-5' exonuclease PolX [Phycisphaerae bacterium]